MLTCLALGHLEIADEDILALQRSGAARLYNLPTGETVEVLAFLVTHRADGERRCHVGFYCRNFKQSLIFAVEAPKQTDPCDHGGAELARLGYHLAPVNLNLSPALRQVVLRDIPPLRRPAAAGKGAEKPDPVPLEMESVSVSLGDSDSAIAKSAALKVNAQRSRQRKMEMLRAILEQALHDAADFPAATHVPEEDGAGALAAALSEAERRLAEETANRRQAEELLDAAERRIREVEELLVEEEKQRAAAVKLRKKLVTLEKRGKELSRERDEVAAQLAEEARQRKVLAEELTLSRQQVEECDRQQAVAADRAAALADLEERCREAQARGADLDAGLAVARKERDELAVARNELQRQLEESRQRVAELEQNQVEGDRAATELAAAEKRAAEAETALARVTGKFERERDQNKQLRAESRKQKRELSAAVKRADTLARQLQEREEALDATQEAGETAGAIAAPDEQLVELQTALAEERSARIQLQEQLDAADRMLASMEKALQAMKKPPTVTATPSVEDAAGKIAELASRLRAAETLREQALQESRRVAKAHADAEQRIAELERALPPHGGEPAVAPVAAPAAAARIPPHQLRPPPRPGAAFHPDWDLQGLPCRSAEQVLQGWESLYNVQLSLEGYPSQYCSAFLVVLRQDRRKRLYLLFSLKQERRTLVCVPSREPDSDAALRKEIDAARDYLKKSGFELESISPSNLATTLGGYFLGG